jgi:CHASE3 domain sensor protein
MRKASKTGGEIMRAIVTVGMVLIVGWYVLGVLAPMYARLAGVLP